MSDNLDSLAMLMAMSMKDGDGTYEVSKLNYYGKKYIDRFRSGIASNRGRRSALECGDSMIDDRVRVIGNSQQNQAIRPFHLSRGQVCALVHGQALECGVGPGKWLGTRNRVIYLTAKDVLRWRKLSEWLEKSDRKYPAKKGTPPRGGDESIFDLLDSFEGDLPDALVPHDTFVDHVSDFPKRLFVSPLWWFAVALALPVMYGGIHLTAWDFHFASKTEQLLWKIACFIIIGTMPITKLARIIWEYLHTEIEWFPETVGQRLWWTLLLPRIGLYGLSRLYIVVEAFISLRHVPIGVYAAVPWVQAIPHV